MQTKKLLFLIKGGTEWIGGLHYIKNLIKTVKLYNPFNDVQLEVDLLVHTREQVRLFDDVKNNLHTIHVYEELIGSEGLAKRAARWAKRKFTGIPHAWLDEFIRRHEYDFAYPCLPRKDFKYYRFAEWIPDFQYLHFPEGSNAAEIEGRKAEFRRICSTSPLVYLSSEHARKDCEKEFPFASPKLRVMKFCVHAEETIFPSPLADVLNKYYMPRKYFIVSNLLAPTKNLFVVIKAVAVLKRSGLPVSVVVTGDIHDYRNPGFKNEIFQMVSAEDVRDNIIFLGLIDRLEQKQLLANSIAIIQPSRFEGWNTLVEEAKCLGQTIVLSDIPVHLEQSPPTGIFFRDNDANDLAGKLETLYRQTGDQPEVKGMATSPDYKKEIEKFAKHFLTTSLLENQQS